MKALVYHGPGQRSWEQMPDPKVIDDTDAIVKIDTVTICGTDLHILKGDVPEVEPGRILGHEAVATIEDVGSAVHDRRPGDRVLLSCITSCGRCRSCRSGRYGQCTGGGGWVFGHLIDGVQAEYARVPFVDTSTYRLPDGVADEQVLNLADIMPTSFEVGVLAGRVQPADTVVIVGAGPIGLSALLTSRLYTPNTVVVVDPSEARRRWALEFGADHAVAPEQAGDLVAELTRGEGADVTMEAVGVPETFELCCELVRAGGHVANIGVHGKPVTLHLEKLWIRDITITTGLVDTNTIPSLLKLIEAGKLAPERLISHRFDLADAMGAYDTFADAGATNAMKVSMRGT
jgi:alcohol dehydrogenase